VVIPALLWGIFVDHQHFVHNHASATGTVAAERTNCSAGPRHCREEAIVSFTTATGRAVRASLFDTDKHVGDTVTVYYSVADPTYAQLSEGWPLDLICFIVFAVTCWLCVTGRFIEKLYSRQHRRRTGSG
jgi:hypothetical protein